MKGSKKVLDIAVKVPSKSAKSAVSRKSKGNKPPQVGVASRQQRSVRFNKRSSNRVGGIIVDGQDFIQAVSLLGNDEPLTLALDLQINPRAGAFQGTRLALLARTFEKYVFRRLKFHIVSSVPTTQTGSYWVAYDKDMADSSPTSDDDGVKQMLALEGARMANVWESVTINGDLTDTQDFYYVNYTGYDGRLTNQGQLWLMHDIANGGGQALKLNLWIEYEIELFDPQLEPEDANLNLDVTTDFTQSSSRRMVMTVNPDFTSSTTPPPKVKVMAEPINSGLGTVYEPFKNLHVRGIPKTNYTALGQPILPPGVYQFDLGITPATCAIPTGWAGNSAHLPAQGFNPIRTFSAITNEETTDLITTGASAYSIYLSSWAAAGQLYGVATRCIFAVKEASYLCWGLVSNSGTGTGHVIPCARIGIEIARLCAHDTYMWYKEHLGSNGTLRLPPTVADDGKEEETDPRLLPTEPVSYSSPGGVRIR